MRRILTSCFSLVALFLSLTGSGFAQSSTFIVPISVKCGTVIQVLHIGVSPVNTIGADRDVPLLGPLFEPPAPPKAPTYDFDTRLRTIPGRVATYPTGLGGGAFKDFRDYRDAAQVDSFLIEISGDLLATDSVVVSWPGDISQYASVWTVKSIGSAALPSTSMLAATSVVIPTDGVSSSYQLLIVKTGALPHDAPQAAVSTVVSGTGQPGFVDPNLITYDRFLPAVTMSVTALGRPAVIQAQRFITPAKNVSFSGPAPAHVGQYHWVVTGVGLTTITAQVWFDFSKFASGVTAPGGVTIYRRATEGSGPFTAVTTVYQGAGSTSLNTGDLTGFGEFLFGSDTNLLTDVAEEGMPVTFGLEQNYPNPFNPSTAIRFTIPRSGAVRLTVHNLLGQVVATLVDQVMDAGSHQVVFNASTIASGPYFYRLQSQGVNETRKMVILK